MIFDDAVPVSRSAPSAVDYAGRLRRMGAALRAEQMAGALEGSLEQSLRYAADRHQFGRPIAKFQAVQHNLAVLAGEVSAATASADAAVCAIARHGIEDERTFLAVAAAKIRCGQAAGAGAAIVHQVHGAMGFTREYSLQHPHPAAVGVARRVRPRDGVGDRAGPPRRENAAATPLWATVTAA